MNGYYNGSLTVPVPVSVAIDDGTGSGVQSATFSAGNATAVPGAFNAGTGKWDFNVPMSAQTVGSEAPLTFTINAVDKVGNTVTGAIPTNAVRPVIKIDNASPTITGVAVVGGVLGAQGVKWFAYDAALKLNIQA